MHEELKKAATDCRGLKWREVLPRGSNYSAIITEEGDTVVSETTLPSEDETAFIVLANPAAVLALIAVNEKLLDKMRTTADELEVACGAYSGDFPDSVNVCVEELRAAIALAEAKP